MGKSERQGQRLDGAGEPEAQGPVHGLTGSVATDMEEGGDVLTQSADYQTVEKALGYLYAHYQRQPQLEELAEVVGLSPFHFQRMFQRWAGVSPKKFLQFLTLNAAKERLRGNEDLLSASMEVGLSGPSRLHDLFVTLEGMTPGEYKAMGAGLVIRYARFASPFGPCFMAATERGLCALSFDPTEDTPVALGLEWPRALLVDDPAFLEGYRAALFDGVGRENPLRLFVQGTPFRLKVWEALLRIPTGRVVSYTQLAQMVGKEDGVRAVASAVASNRISLLIPCHRVIRGLGEMGGYLWGIPRKLALIGWEATHPAGWGHGQPSP